MELTVTADLRAAQSLIAKYPEAARASAISRVTEAALLADGVIVQRTPVGAGPIHLRDTIFHKVNQFGDTVRGIVGTPAPYGLPVELGTRPHFPPVAPIQHWVEKKLGYGEKEAKSIAFLIARAISRRGTKGQYMFSANFQDLQSRILTILNKIPDDILAQIRKN